MFGYNVYDNEGWTCYQCFSREEAEDMRGSIIWNYMAKDLHFMVEDDWNSISISVIHQKIKRSEMTAIFLLRNFQNIQTLEIFRKLCLEKFSEFSENFESEAFRIFGIFRIFVIASNARRRNFQNFQNIQKIIF